MMDAEGRIIPVVEDDQGEGYKDLLDQHDLEQISELEKKLKKLQEKATQQEHSQRFKK